LPLLLIALDAAMRRHFDAAADTLLIFTPLLSRCADERAQDRRYFFIVDIFDISPLPPSPLSFCSLSRASALR